MHWGSLVCYRHWSGDMPKLQSALSCTENRHERYRQGNSVKCVPFSDHKRGPAPLMKIDAEGIGPTRAKWAAVKCFFLSFFLRVCVSYCQCQLDFMPSFLSIWADSSLYETIILPPTLCVFSAIGGKGRIPFYPCHPFLLVKVRGSERGYGSSKWDSLSFGVMQGCSGNITCASAYLDVCMHSTRPLIDPSHAVIHVCAFDGPLPAFCFYALLPVALWANKLGFPSN